MNDFEAGKSHLVERLKKEPDFLTRSMQEKKKHEKGEVGQEAKTKEESLKSEINDKEGKGHHRKKTEVTASAEVLNGLKLAEFNVYSPKGPYGYFEALQGEDKEGELIKEIKAAVGYNKDIAPYLNFFIAAGLVHETIFKHKAVVGDIHTHLPRKIASFRSVPLFSGDPVPGKSEIYAESMTKPLFRFGAKGEFKIAKGVEADYIAAQEVWGTKPAYHIAELDVVKELNSKFKIGAEFLSETNVAPFSAGPVLKIGPMNIGFNVSPNGKDKKAYVRFHIGGH